MAGPSNNGRKDSTGSVITGKSSLDQARAVVAHKGGSLFVVTHGWFLRWSVEERDDIFMTGTNAFQVNVITLLGGQAWSMEFAEAHIHKAKKTWVCLVEMKQVDLYLC